MTFGKILTDLSSGKLSLERAYEEMSSKDKMKTINYYAHIQDIRQEPLNDVQLQELEQIVDILQILYTSGQSPIDDSTYDTLEEMLVDMGIPRLNGSIEINDAKKVNHGYETLYGTLDKVYYLTSDEPRTNKSRKTLDEWILSAERLYEKNTGKKINLNDVTIVVQAKYDGISAGLEWNKVTPLWLTRGKNDKASDISDFMKIFNDVYCGDSACGQKFEVMMSEENKDKVNEFVSQPYKNSRQAVISTFNNSEPDFKVEYLYPIPLRYMLSGEKVEQIHPLQLEKFPTMVCKFGDREKIRKFANEHRYVEINGMHFRTDGAVLTIVDQKICEALGRDNKINNFEVAYKFTEETAYSKVKTVEFYVSEFGYITPVLVVNDVILKGNTINHISLSNKERFDELNLSYGDEVKILYDIIPYATVDEKCQRMKYGRKIEFIQNCPRCHEPLDLNAVQVQCKNPRCPSRLVGRVMNYCASLRIANIGFQTLDALYTAGFLNDGILSLYKLKKKKDHIELIEGFGRLKTRKMIREIEAKRRVKDYDFFGAYGIEGLSRKTFQLIFTNIKLEDFINLIKMKNWDLMFAKLVIIPSIGNSKADALVSFFKDDLNRKELMKIMQEIFIEETFSKEFIVKKGVMVFTGCRPSPELEEKLIQDGYEVLDGWRNTATSLVVPYEGFTSNKTAKALEKGIKIVTIDSVRNRYSQEDV